MPDTAESSAVNVAAYPPRTAEEQGELRTFARTTPFVYGVWNRFKQLYKAAEADPNADPVLLGALLAHIENSPIALGGKDPRLQFDNAASVSSVLPHGDYLFAVGGYYYWSSKQFIVCQPNPDNPLKPRQVAVLEMTDFQGDVSEMILCGTLVCIFSRDRSGSNILHIVDIVNPTNPQRCGSLKFSRPVYPYDHTDTSISVYLSAAKKGSDKPHALAFVDLMNPGSPRLSNEMPIKGLSGEATAFSADNGLAAFIVPPRGFTWWSMPQKGGVGFADVTNALNGHVVGNVEIESPLCVARKGAYTYVGVGTNSSPQKGLQIVDVSDPHRPRLAGFCSTDDAPSYLFPSDNGFVYAATYGGTLYTFDVRDPMHPKRTDTMTRLQGAKAIIPAGSVAYVPTHWQGMALISLTPPQAPARVGAPPSGDTIGYMKRRGRRILRRLRKSDPARYTEIATEMLLALADKQPTIDLTRHWASVDVLFGAGDRFRQTKHGRGRYIPTGKTLPKILLRTREERAPEAWDAHSEQLVRLLTAPDLPILVYSFAARALYATRKPLPTISDSVAEQWLNGTDPLMTALANRILTARLFSWETLPASLVADAFFQANASTRRQLVRERIGGWASKRNWAEPFALRLAERIRQTASGGTMLSARQRDAGTLLAQQFAWAITPRLEAILPLVAPFTASGNAALVSLLTTAAQQIDPNNVQMWLQELNKVADTVLREPVFAALEKGLQRAQFHRNIVRWLIFDAESFMREAGWRLIAASTTSGEVLREVWTELLSSTQPTAALTTAMGSAYALGLLDRAGIGAAELAGYVAERDFLVELLSPEAFRAVAATAPAAVVLSLIAAAPDAHWQKLRGEWLAGLQNGVGTEAIWLAAEKSMEGDSTGRLEARLLRDTEIAATMLSVPDEALLEIRMPEFGAALGAWMRRYIDRFTKNSPLLFAAATHPLPAIREPALDRVSELGMDMPFGLRLMESLVPPSVAVGKAFFDSEPSGGPQEPDYALALSDSPFIEVRTEGIEYIRRRWDTLPQERVLIALFENPAPEIQAFVAEQLGVDLPVPAATPEFDGEVLRTQNRARRAKERIKVRQTATPSVDTATLLVLARGRTPRDAEWALGELARRAALGEQVDGIVVEGTVGI